MASCSSTYTSLATVCSPSTRLEPFSELLQGRYPVPPLTISSGPDFGDALTLGVGPSVEIGENVSCQLQEEDAALETPHLVQVLTT